MLPFIPVEYAYVKEIADAQIERLVAQLGNESYREREAATESLAMIGEPALERLRKAASSEDLEVRCRASKLIAPIEDCLVKRRNQELIEKFILQLGSDSDEKREAAMQSLRAIGEPALVSLRKASQTHSELEIRLRASGLVKQMELCVSDKEIKKICQDILDSMPPPLPRATEAR